MAPVGGLFVLDNSDWLTPAWTSPGGYDPAGSGRWPTGLKAKAIRQDSVTGRCKCQLPQAAELLGTLLEDLQGVLDD